jgi:hypothetical protein
MIFKSAFPNAPTVELVIDGVSVDYTAVQSVTLTSTENSHDYAELVVVGLIPDYVTEYSDRPIYVSVSYSPTQKFSFYGYVAFVTPEAITRRGYINNSPIQRATISCFGSSYDMKAKKSRVWEKVNLQQVVESIAQTYRYSYQVPDDSFIYSRITQSNESDVSLLIRLCESYGYRVTFSGANIHVYDPYKAMSRNMPYAELTTIVNDESNARFAPGRIMEFTGTFGSMTPEGSSNEFKIETLDQNGLPLSYTTSNGGMGMGTAVPSRFTDSVPISAVSYSSAKRFGDALSRRYLPYHADAIVTGLPEILPGSVVRVNGYNSKFDGFWMVTSATQKMSRSNYITELSLVKDSVNDDLPITVNGTPYSYPQEPALDKGRWVAETPVYSLYA